MVVGLLLIEIKGIWEHWKNGLPPDYCTGIVGTIICQNSKVPSFQTKIIYQVI
jgi:hypothetical protein